MSFWDFMSDFILIINDIFSIGLFDVAVNGGQVLTITVGTLIVGIIIVSTALFYIIPRK